MDVNEPYRSCKYINTAPYDIVMAKSPPCTISSSIAIRSGQNEQFHHVLVVLPASDMIVLGLGPQLCVI